MADAFALAQAETAASTPAAAVAVADPAVTSRLLAACAVIAAPPTYQSVAEANSWVMGLAQSDECWPTCLAALERASPVDTHVLLSLCLSLVRQNKLVMSNPTVEAA